MKKEDSHVDQEAYVYLAAPLFNSAEREFNASLKRNLSIHFRVYLPQEDGGLMADMVSRGVEPRLAASRVFHKDISALNDCDLFLIIMDGRTIDEGAAFELGYAYAMSKPCYGLQTDVRRVVHGGNNPMIDKAVRHIFTSVDSLLSWAEEFKEGHASHKLKTAV